MLVHESVKLTLLYEDVGEVDLSWYL